jgi:hypothetical protein
MTTHKVVAHAEWVAARKKHLAKEKEFTRLRDQLSRERRDLPWERASSHADRKGRNSRSEDRPHAPCRAGAMPSATIKDLPKATGGSAADSVRECQRGRTAHRRAPGHGR